MIDAFLALSYAAVVVATTVAAWRGYAFRSGSWLGAVHPRWALLRRAFHAISRGVDAGFLCTLVLSLAIVVTREYGGPSTLAPKWSGWPLAALALSLSLLVVRTGLGESTSNYLPLSLLAAPVASPGRSTDKRMPCTDVHYANRDWTALLSPSAIYGALGLCMALNMAPFPLNRIIGPDALRWWVVGALGFLVVTHVVSSAAAATAGTRSIRGHTAFGLRQFEYSFDDLWISYQSRRLPSREYLLVTKCGSHPILFSSHAEGYQELCQRVLTQVVRAVSRDSSECPGRDGQ